MEKERIQAALEMQRKANESVCDRRIEDEAQKIRNNIDLEKQKWVNKVDVNEHKYKWKRRNMQN